MSEGAVVGPVRAGALELRATYRLRVGREVAGELVAAVGSMAPRACLDAAGLREDLAHLLQVLHEVRELGHYGLQEYLISAAALRGIARLFPHVEDARGSRYRMEDEAKGFRWGQMGGLTERERKILERATEGPYEEFLEDRRRCPSPEEELAACGEELGWLAGAFGEVGDEEVAEECRRVADDLFQAVQEIPEVLRVAERFEDVRSAEVSSMQRSVTIASRFTILPDDRRIPGGG